MKELKITVFWTVTPCILAGGCKIVSEKPDAPIFKVDEAPKLHEEINIFMFIDPLLARMCGWKFNFKSCNFNLT
jgi:hypothetical protein